MEFEQYKTDRELITKEVHIIEGVSGVGKSTLVSRLTQWLSGQGYSVKS